MSPEVLSMREPEERATAEQAHALSGRYIHFGPFRIDQHRQEVTCQGSRLKLQGKVYQVLIALVEKPGEVVTREELRAKLWPADTHVNYDANVNTTVNKLRQALGDSTDKPLYIETIPRKGYCLLVPTEVSDRPGSNLFPQHDARPGFAKKSPQASNGLQLSKSDIWVMLAVIGLILAGMLLGAGITRLWMNHAMPVAPFSVVIVLSKTARFLV